MSIQIGTQLRQLRIRDGRTQEDLAAALGVTAQAVSRWEKSICCPDIGLLPSIAGYFGVSIDRLFGYDSDRQKKLDSLCEKLKRMNRENNGEDVSMDECIRLAREGLVEFPGNERVMLCLADILYNAGYVRYGEFHSTDKNGYEVFDVERHRKYTEWQEAISIYEKVIATLDDGDDKYEAKLNLANLYAVTGETSKAAKLAENAPCISSCREFLSIMGCSGRKRSAAYEKSVIAFARRLIQLMIHCEISRSTADPGMTAKSVAAAIGIGEAVIGVGYSGSDVLVSDMSKAELFLADRLWQSRDEDGAFMALESALSHARAFDCGSVGLAKALPELFPWWFVKDVRAENIKDDPRWNEWVERCRQKD